MKKLGYAHGQTLVVCGRADGFVRPASRPD
jgi:hypothetical protein